MTKPNATPVHFHAGHNDAGYLPEADVATFATFEDAKVFMISELLEAAENLATWSESHDCHDVPCPTLGDECPEQLANAAALLAEDLNLESGPDWQANLSDGRSLPVSWWIMSCEWPDCAYHDHEDEPAHDYKAPPLPGAYREIIGEAVEAEHSCEDTTCDIAAMLANGFVIGAAHSLMAATDCPETETVMASYLEHGAEHVRAAIGSDLYDCEDWPGWSEHHDRYARPCEDCGARSYAERNFEPLECGCCGADLVPTERHARRIGADWHGGQSSALYAFASTGTVRPDLAAEVEAEVTGDESKLLLRWLERNAPEPNFWSLLESPPAGCSEVAALWSWSLNYDGGKGPATLFLDLIGYSEDEHGQALYDLSSGSLGYVEVEHLRDALSDYLADPFAVRCFVEQLLEAEASR